MAEQLDLNLLLKAKTEGLSSFNEAGSVIGGLGAAAAAAGLVIAGALVVGGAQAVKMAGDFQASMELIKTQAGGTQQEVDNMSAAILQMASSVGTAPEELAAGLYHLESAGFRGATALDALRIAAEGAKVGNANLEDVTNALDAVLVAGVPEAKNMTEAMGELNAIVGAGDMRMQDLADAMSTGILATAKTFGLGLKDVGAALAVFGDNNQRGSEAATRLRMAISLMGAPSRAAAKALGEVGISSTQLADDMRSGGLVQAMQDLQDHLKASGLTASQQADVLAKAFGGGKTSSSILLLLDQLDRLKTKEEEVGAGATKFPTAWEATQKNFNFQMDAAKAAINAAAIQIGTVLIPYVAQLLRVLTPLIPVVATWVTQMLTHLPQAITATQKAIAEVEAVIRTAIQDWNAARKAVSDNRDVLEALGFTIATIVAPTLLNLTVLAAVNAVRSMIAMAVSTAQATVAFVAQNIEMLVMNARLDVVIASMVLYAAWSGIVKVATMAWTAAQAALDFALDANPISLLIIAIAVLIGLIVIATTNTYGLRDAMASWGAVNTKGFFDAVNDGLISFIRWVQSAVQEVENLISAIANLGNIKLPGGVSLGDVLGAITNPIGAIGSVIPHAQGGIVTRPHIGLVGEAGPEAIIPLNRVGSFGGPTIHINLSGSVISSDAAQKQLVRLVSAEVVRSVTSTAFR